MSIQSYVQALQSEPCTEFRETGAHNIDVCCGDEVFHIESDAAIELTNDLYANRDGVYAEAVARRDGACIRVQMALASTRRMRN